MEDKQLLLRRIAVSRSLIRTLVSFQKTFPFAREECSELVELEKRELRENIKALFRRGHDQSTVDSRETTGA